MGIHQQQQLKESSIFRFAVEVLQLNNYSFLFL